MKLPVCIALVSGLCVMAQTPGQSPVPQQEPTLTGFIDLGYRWQTGVGGSEQTYRSIVNFGSGPKMLGTEFTITSASKRLFDRIDVRAYDWGDDPYSTLHVNAKKSKWYDLNADYRNIAYFSNMPSFADPLLSRGLLLNEQSSDTHKRMTSIQLDLLPGHWFVPYFGFDRASEDGHGVNTFVSDSNEYAVPATVRDSQNNYRGGVRMDWRRLHVTLEQGGTTYRNDDSVFQLPGSTNYGNRNVSFFGQTLSLTSLLEAYGIRGDSIYTRATLNSNVTSWLDVYGQFLFSQPHNDVSFQLNSTGNAVISSQLLFYSSQQYLLSAEAKLPHTTGTFGFDIRPLRKVRILESWLTDRLHNNSAATAQQNPVTTSSALSSSLASNYNQEQVDVLLDASKRLTLRGAYRYEWGHANDITLPAAGLVSMDSGTLRRHVGIGGVSYRPSAKISLHGDLEGASSSGVYFRTSLHNYQKFRIQASYQATSSWRFAFDANLMHNQNPTALNTPGTGSYDSMAHQVTLSFLYAPPEKSRWNLQGSYTRSAMRSDVDYLDPGTLLTLSDHYRDNGHSVSALFRANLPGFQQRTSAISLGGSFVVTSGSRPTSYFQPLAKVSVPLNRNLAWVSEWRYYGFGESFYSYESFRSHLVTTGVRITR